MPYERSHVEIMEAHKDKMFDAIKKTMVATVINVYPARQTVDVQTAVQNPLWDEYGNVTFEPPHVFSDVPLGVMRGGGFFVWLPVQKGDSVLLIYTDLSTDAWRGGNGTQPGFVGKHTTDSMFAVPFCAPDSQMFVDPNNDPDKIIIGQDGGPAQIRLSATDIELGISPGDAAALASKVDAGFTQIINALNSSIGTAHTHSTPSGASGPPIPATPFSSVSSTASNLVKITS